MRVDELALAAAKRPLAAAAFLTRLPVGRLIVFDGNDVARSAPFFPLVGALVGAAAGGSADALAGLLPPLLAGTIAATLGVALTGAMHLDALADSADALGGSTREEALRIMQDHSIGAFGVAALALALIARIAAYAEMSAAGGALAAATAAAASARWTPLPIAAALRPIRATGQGRLLAGPAMAGRAIAGFGLASAITFAAIGARAIPVLVAVCACALLLGLAYRYWLGGVTGDSLGAASEIAEIASLITLVALL